MIFVTVGTQLPFNRLLKAMNEWATQTNEPVIAQTNDTENHWAHLECYESLKEADFTHFINEARIIVAHAGIGSIMSALKAKKPIIVMPRLAYLGEHRNEHQLSTTMALHKEGYIHAAYDEKMLKELLEAPLLPPLRSINSFTSPYLIENLIKAIEE